MYSRADMPPTTKYIIPLLGTALILVAKFLARKTPLKTAAKMRRMKWLVLLGMMQKIVGIM